MKYKIYTQKSDFNGTDSVEIGPGRYAGKHWQDGFIFISEDVFGIAQSIIIKSFSDYDPYDMNDIPVSEAKEIARDMKKMSRHLSSSKIDDAISMLDKNNFAFETHKNEINNNREQLGGFLMVLADHIERFCENEKYICVLGL